MDIKKTYRTYTAKNGHTSRYEPPRDVKKAIEEKLVVLREFYVVDDKNEADVRAQMEKAIAERPDVDFDRILDNFARRLINAKLG